MRYISGGLVARDESGDGRRVAFVQAEDGRVFVETPMDRAFGVVPTLRVTSPEEDVMAALGGGAPFTCTVQKSAGGPAFELAIDPVEGDAGNGAISGVI